MNMKLPPYLDPDNRAEEHAALIHMDVDFSEYEWMAEDLEAFDRQVEEEFWEEAFLEACFEEMLEEEEAQWEYFAGSQDTNRLSSEVSPYKVFGSKLNPDAPEFVPTAPGKSKA